MTKDEARREAISQWRALPILNQQVATAAEFARLLAPTLGFDTLGDRERVITAWLVRDVESREVALRVFDARTKAAKSVAR
ncbi:MAG: hypothetical protein ABI216_21275 [Devosia sp.]